MITRRTLTQSIVLFGAFCLACEGDSTTSDSDNAPDPDAGGEVGDDADVAPDAAVDTAFSDPLARGNSAPTLGGAGDRRAPIGVSTVIVLDARDPDGGPLEYFANGVPDGARFHKATGIFVWTPTESDLGRTASILFGVRDEHGAEDSRLMMIEVVENADKTAPQLYLPTQPVLWPTGQITVWAIPVSDPDGDSVTLTLEPGAPPGMSVDGEFLSWEAPNSAAGQTLPIGLVAEDAGGLSTRGGLRVAVVETPTDALPAMTIGPGGHLSVDLIPDRAAEPRDAFNCSAGVALDALAGSSLSECMLEWDVPRSAAGNAYSLTFGVDLITSPESPDVIRTLSVSVSDSASCSPVTEFMEEAVLLEPDGGGLATFTGTFCSPETRGTLLFDMPIPADAGRLQALLIHDNADSSDLDLLVECSDSEGLSVGLVGEELVTLEVTGGDICYVDVTSYAPVIIATEFELLVLTEAADVGPACTDDATSFDLLLVGDIEFRMACPGAQDEFALDTPVGTVTTLCETAELDLELWATDGSRERLVDYVATDGDEETLTLDRSLLLDGETPIVRVVPWTIDTAGAEFLIEALGGAP
jgi:hypothetical protein